MRVKRRGGYLLTTLIFLVEGWDTNVIIISIIIWQAFRCKTSWAAVPTDWELPSPMVPCCLADYLDQELARML